MGKFYLNTKHIGVILYACVILISAGPSRAAFLDKASIELIREATFEVVVPKPEKDSLSYEMPLPMDLLPYAIRKDKYYSIGTAFAISADRFVSAAHAVNLGVRSQFLQVYLRDKDGKVFTIDKIFKYSEQKDFVVFSLRGEKPGKWLPINLSAAINDKVYAVGNALGEGIVIRDGIYTSNTPEEYDGEWQWMRFSAAASPGNSGGPLLDDQGKVVGIVLRKSPNENLNFALPIGEVINAKENLATLRKKGMYWLDNMDMTQRMDLKKAFQLPKSYSELNHELIKVDAQYLGQTIKDLLSENQKNIFPNGEGSTRLLHQVRSAVFPHIIAKTSDGTWDAFYPTKIDSADLGDNGFLHSGGLGRSMYMLLRKPDKISLAELFKDSKLFMDLILKGNPARRPVGPKNIKVTSFGKAHQEYMFTDSYQRKWKIMTWQLEYDDSMGVIFALPVPGGSVIMMRGGPTRFAEEFVLHLKTIADFVYVSYYGTLEQWREFLKSRELLPPIFASININFEYEKYFKYASNRMAFSYGPDFMKITKNSDLQLKFSYFKEKGKTVWDVAGLIIGDDKNSQSYVTISRSMRPPESLADKDRQDWDNISNRRMPFNKSSFTSDKYTTIGTVYTQQAAENLASAPLLYTVFYGMSGNLEQKTVAEKLDKFTQDLVIKEH